MMVLGLTGSIAMGKTTVARMFRSLGIPVYEADAAVHELLLPGGMAVAAVRSAFPGTEAANGGIDRRKLGALVFQDGAQLQVLEDILHPMVRTLERAFRKARQRQGCRLVVLDVPLLYETGGEGRCDAVAVVTAPTFMQSRRALARPGMTADRFARIVACQIDNREKERRADFIIRSGLGRYHALNQTRKIVKRMTPYTDTARP